MPFRKELRVFYGHHWYTVTRPRILRRAGGRFNKQGRYLGGAHCEQCGRPDRKLIYTFSDRALVDGRIERRMFWLGPENRVWHDQLANPVPSLRLKGLPRKIRVILGVAHLNHVAGDDRDGNLRALCGWCHLSHDAVQHKETRSTRKDAARPMKFPFPQPRRGEYADELDFCRAMQRWAVLDGDGPQRSICIDDWFAEELLILEERESVRAQGAA